MKRKNKFSRNFPFNGTFLKLWFAILLLTHVVFQFQAQTPNRAAGANPWPFDNLTANFSVTVNIVSGTGKSFNNNLLGTNIDINSLSKSDVIEVTRNSSNQSLQGFNSVKLQNFMTGFDPVSLRWPQGAFANVYHWEEIVVNGVTYPADSRLGSDVLASKNPIALGPSSLRLGYSGLKTIHSRPASQNGQFDILTVLNINNDVNMSSGRRIDAMRKDGFDVRDVELGNEFFWGNQRSNAVSTTAQYVQRAKSVVTEVRKRGGSIPMKFSIPISWQRGLPGHIANHTSYNNELTADKSYYDAISVHRYVENDEEADNHPTANSYRFILTARKTMNDDVINYCRANYGKNSNGSYKQLWLTEWGVSCKAASTKDWAASFLGQANTYLYLIENDDKYQRVNWFQAFNANQFYDYATSTSFVKTGFGDVYETMRNALKNTSLYDVVLTSPDIKKSGVNQGVKAVSAVAVKDQNGKIKIVAVNISNQTATMLIKFNGTTKYTGSYTQSGIRFGHLGKSYKDKINVSESGSGTVTLKPFSVNVISNVTIPSVGFKSAVLTDIEKQSETSSSLTIYPNPSQSGIFNINTSDKWEVYNLLGKKVLDGMGDKVDITSLIKGTYYLRTGSESQALIYK